MAIVLCVTHSGDFYTIDNVMSALCDLGHDPVRLDSDLFPDQLRFTADPDGGLLQLVLPDRRIARDEIGAVWFRKVFGPKFAHPPGDDLIGGCIRESAAALKGMLGWFRDLPCINPVGSGIDGEDKLYQMKLAREAGMRVPETLISNDPEAVRAFFHRLGGNVVTKMLTPLEISMGRPERFVYTSKVREEDLEDLDGLRYSPMVFQELIEKDVELRVAFVDGETYTGAIDASETEKGRFDWRRSEMGTAHWTKSEVPDALCAQMKRFMAAMGLIFGAFDFIRTPEGEHVFLEVNPAGEWGMLEKFLGLPISGAIARALVNRL